MMTRGKATSVGTRAGSRLLVLTALVLFIGPMLHADAYPSSSTGAVGSVAGVTAAEACEHPSTPPWFHHRLERAINVSSDLLPGWIRSRDIARIICWQGTDFQETFSQDGPTYYRWHGIFAMTQQEVATIRGPWLLRTRYGGARLRSACFLGGWARCPHTALNQRITQQIIAGLRFIWENYGTPREAWEHVVRTGRFNAYPRPETSDMPVADPLHRCPVDGSVIYADTFGDYRAGGGYHPHWGNDIVAPAGRTVRAPFDGLAVAHTDAWFAGNSVTVVGEDGYVRNAHLSRFGHLGYVKAGTIIGYVGATGDADGSHNHFEWHPWAAPAHLHSAPSGSSLIMDAIDPFPFLKKACGPSALVPSPP